MKPTHTAQKPVELRVLGSPCQRVFEELKKRFSVESYTFDLGSIQVGSDAEFSRVEANVAFCLRRLQLLFHLATTPAVTTSDALISLCSLLTRDLQTLEPHFGEGLDTVVSNLHTHIDDLIDALITQSRELAPYPEGYEVLVVELQ
ncbi:hypothetical protein [Rhodococcus phenolicus]|uniref:hypothetical protein n=1 Tax=Rhodococcus phenolicus TaxID=263849 RepID=UPI000B203B57|nr:hypothetical protein [Rhodococcus phenolicus]